MTSKHQTIIDNFLRWGEDCDKLYAAVMIGSQAREDHPSDAYSDLDIIMFVDDPPWFLSSDEWLEELGCFHVSFIEDTIAGGKERRVLFEGALDVDFIILPQNVMYAPGDEAMSALARGYRILIDKAGLKNVMPGPAAAKRPPAMPTEWDFVNLVNDFWYHALWAAKKLLRGELWTAKYCVDSYMKGKLLSMIEYHARAAHGPDYDFWHSGRFLEEWAESWIVERLPQCFSHYDKEDIKAALLSTMALFQSIAAEIAEKLAFAYPKAADEYAHAWVMAAL